MEGTVGSTAGYEFGPSENETLGRAARWIGFWSWVSLLSGFAWTLGGAVAGDPSGLILGPAYIVVGVFFRGAAGSMRSVIETAGDDVAHLMTAIEKLSSAFRIMGLLVIAAVVLGLLAGLAGVTFAS